MIHDREKFSFCSLIFPFSPFHYTDYLFYFLLLQVGILLVWQRLVVGDGSHMVIVMVHARKAWRLMRDLFVVLLRGGSCSDELDCYD